MRRTGLEEQIHYSAIAFRSLLDSLARPGKINQLASPDFLGTPPTYFSNAQSTDLPVNLFALGALFSLLDGETSFVLSANGQWLDPSAPVSRWLALRSGAHLELPISAQFAFFCDGSSGGQLIQLNTGTLLEPEVSSTAIYCVEELADSLKENKDHDQWMSLELTGPGIEKQSAIYVKGLEEREIDLIKQTRQGYPLGIDVYLIDATGQCVGLPRTTKIQIVRRG